MLKLRTRHGSVTSLLSKNSKDDLTTEINVTDELDSARFELKTSFGRKFQIATVPKFYCIQIIMSMCCADISPHFNKNIETDNRDKYIILKLTVLVLILRWHIYLDKVCHLIHTHQKRHIFQRRTKLLDYVVAFTQQSRQQITVYANNRVATICRNSHLHPHCRALGKNKKFQPKGVSLV